MKKTNNRKTFFGKVKWILLVMVAWGLVSLLALLGSAATATSSYDCLQLSVTSDGVVNIKQTNNGWIVELYGKTTGTCTKKHETVDASFSITTTGTKNNGSVRAVDFKITTTGMKTNVTGVAKRLDSSTTSLSYTATSGSGVVTCTTITIVITDIVQESLGVTTTTVFSPDEGGNYTVDGSTIFAETTITEADSHIFELVAQPSPGYDFCGWIIDGKLQPFAAEYSLHGNNSRTVTPLFAKSGSALYVIKDASPVTYYKYLDHAITAAGTSGTVVVYKDGKAYSSDGSNSFTVPSKVTLLIPFDDEYTVITSDDKETLAKGSGSGTPTLHRQLTLPFGTSLTVNGALCVGSQASYQMVGQIGPYGAIKLEKHANITIANGANLYAWGYIFPGDTGAGTVTVQNGGKVYEVAAIADYPGSVSSTTNLLPAFPLRAYTLRNVEVPMTLEYGAKNFGFYSIYSGSASKKYPGFLNFVSNNSADNPLFKPASEGAYVTKSYSAGKQIISLVGNMSLNAISITLENQTVASDDTSGLPLPSCFELSHAGGTMTLGDNVIITEGAKLYIASDSTVENGGKNIYVLAAADDSGAKVATDLHGVSYTKVDKDAVVDINGTVNISKGGIFTSNGKASIISSEGTGVINITNGATSATISIKYNQSTSQSITFTSAFLKNGDGAYMATAENGSYNYCLYDDKWESGGTVDTITVTQTPTCSAAGSKHVVCGDRSKDIEIPKTGVHIWTDHTQNGNIHTCACEYGCGTDVVLNVAYRLDDYLWFNGSTKESFLVDELNGVTVSENIQTVLIKDKGIRYFVKAIPADEIPDDLTFTIYIGGGEATFTVRLADYVTDDEELKQALLNYGTAAKDYFEKTYKKSGSETFEKPSYNLINPTDENMSSKPFADENVTVSIVTKGATIYFDEAMRLAVKYQISNASTDTVTVGGVEYTIVQVGLLVKELGADWTMAEALTTHFASTAANNVKAYLAYNAANVTVTPGGALNQPNTDIKGETATDLSKYSSNGLIVFDLKSEDYASGFALRTYAVLQDKNGNVQCIYGKQYGYGLGAYVNAMYMDGATALADKSFNNLLEQAWALAQAAK